MEPKTGLSKTFCSQHPQFNLIFFCDDPCGTSICILCRTNSHRDHKVISLQAKVAQLKEKLQRVLANATSEKQAIRNRQTTLRKAQEDIEGSTQEVVAQMRYQLAEVTRQLSAISSKQMTVIQEAKRKRLLKFNEELFELQKLNQQRTNIQESANRLLEQPPTAGFINQANQFLLNEPTQPFQETQDGEEWWKKVLYKPVNVHSEEFLNYVEDHILGHVTAVQIAERSPTTDENTDLTTSEQASKITSKATAHSSGRSPSYCTDVTKGARSSVWNNISESHLSNVAETDRDIFTIPRSSIELNYSIIVSDSMWVCGWSRN